MLGWGAHSGLLGGASKLPYWLSGDVFSAPLADRKENEYRTSAADGMWERLEKAGIAKREDDGAFRITAVGDQMNLTGNCAIYDGGEPPKCSSCSR